MKWEDKDKILLGVVGGMGSYATLNFFERILKAFPGEKDWDKPRLIIDNYSTLPSRVRAILYNENAEVLKDKLSRSINNLINAGAENIVLACHTSHFFLPDIQNEVPALSGKILNLIELAKKESISLNCKKVLLLASEGTVQSGIYSQIFKNELAIEEPSDFELVSVRELIETVKQNKITESALDKFSRLVNDSEIPVILGCTELPVLRQKCIEGGIYFTPPIIDPLQSVIDIIVQKNEMN